MTLLCKFTMFSPRDRLRSKVRSLGFNAIMLCCAAASSEFVSIAVKGAGEPFDGSYKLSPVKCNRIPDGWKSAVDANSGKTYYWQISKLQECSQALRDAWAGSPPLPGSESDTPATWDLPGWAKLSKVWDFSLVWVKADDPEVTLSYTRKKGGILIWHTWSLQIQDLLHGWKKHVDPDGEIFYYNKDLSQRREAGNPPLPEEPIPAPFYCASGNATPEGRGVRNLIPVTPDPKPVPDRCNWRLSEYFQIGWQNAAKYADNLPTLDFLPVAFLKDHRVVESEQSTKWIGPYLANIIGGIYLDRM